MPPLLSYTDYKVGWISAVPIEMAAARAMLDEVHPDLPTPANDDNAYILGQIAGHNIVIACLPSGEYGISSAATVARQLLSTFSAVRFGLMVGIGSGIWSERADIRLGDIVVSHPSKTHGGVIQYDFGKALTGGQFERTGMLNRPPQILLTAISKLRSYHATDGSRVSEWVASAVAKSLVAPSILARPDLVDRLYEADYPHDPNQATCETCDQDRVVDRSLRANANSLIHYGLILSGDQVIKDSQVRDRLAKEEAYCVEMEAAGLMNHFPCLVIRGICDYADSHKNKEWQGYAAAAAAAYAKELLRFVPISEATMTQSANDDILLLDERASKYIEKLPRAENAAYNSILGEKRPFCLPNTRVQILDTISSWCKDDTAPCIFWLSGMAGTGKSTVARTVADNFANQEYIAVSFFFSRGGGDLASSSKLVPTLAAQFANRDPQLRHLISQTIQKNPEVVSEGFSSQWRQLILEPMKQLEQKFQASKTYTITVDALDECENEEDITRMLQQFPKISQIRQPRVRMFITSRPETRICVDFSRSARSTHRPFRLRDIESSITESDIRVYLSHTLGEIAQYRPAPPGWPSESEIRCLAAQASGLFIYAATACQFIKKKHRPPADLLSLFLSNSQNKSWKAAHKSLDNLYVQIISKSLFGFLEDDDDDEVQAEAVIHFRRIIGPIVLLFDTLPVAPYSKLIGVEESTVFSHISELSSVLDIPENSNSPVRLLHPSFRDFLLSPDRCEPDFLIDEKESHTALANCCLALMGRSLRQNICGFSLPAISLLDVSTKIVKDCIPKELEYACHNWVRHVLASDMDLSDGGEVHLFLQTHLLHWLEAQGWLRRVSDSFQSLISLQARIATSTGPSSLLYQFLEDARRFILANRWITDNHPLQLYFSAIAFAPQSSMVRQIFERSAPRWVVRLPRGPPSWGPRLLVGHANAVASIVFLSTGELVSGADDGIIKIWDISTQSVLRTLQGSNSRVTGLHPRDEGLWSVSDDQFIRLWGPESGELLRAYPLPDLAYGNPLAFHPEGSIIWGSEDGFINKVCSATGTVTQRFKAHPSGIDSISISPEGVVASCYEDDIKLWDVHNGVMIKVLQPSTMEEDEDDASIQFTPDGLFLAFRTPYWIEFLETGTGRVSHQLAGGNITGFTYKFVCHASHPQPVMTKSDRIKIGGPESLLSLTSIDHITCCDTSGDGRILATGLRNGTVQLHFLDDKSHIDEGKTPENFECLTLLPSTQRLITESATEIELWDLPRWEVLSTLSIDQFKSRGVSDAHWHWSPSATKVAFSDNYGQYTMVNVKTGDVLSRFHGPYSSIIIGWALSANGDLLAEATLSGATVYDTTTGSIICGMSRQHLSSNWWEIRSASLVFSPDGQYLSIRWRGGELFIFETTSGRAVLKITHTYTEDTSVFSPDSKLLAFLTDHGAKLHMFRIESGELVYSHAWGDGHRPLFSTLRFLPDCRTLQILSHTDGTPEIWNRADRILEFDIMSGAATEKPHPCTYVSPRAWQKWSLGSSSAPSFEEKLSVEDDWVLFDRARILWLPPEYTSETMCWDSTGDTLVFSTQYGGCEHIVFDLDLLSSVVAGGL